MRLVRHDDDIMSLGEWFVRFFELLHCGEDDAIRLPAVKKLLEILAALRLNRILPKKVPALGELSVQLVVKIVAVGDNNYGGRVQCLLQEMGIEDHGQGFSAALRMPEHSAAPVGCYSFFRGLDGLTDGKVLVVSGEDFELFQSLVGEADEVLDDVKQALLLEHPLEERVKLCILRVLIAAVPRFPLHEPVFTGGDGSCFACQMVAHDADAVVNEHGRYLMHIVTDLRIRL